MEGRRRLRDVRGLLREAQVPPRAGQGVRRGRGDEGEGRGAGDAEDVEGTRIRNSCTEDTDVENSGTGNSVGIGSSANIHTDPLFFDASAGDLRLELGSPCVDSSAGNDSVELDEDIFYQSRPVDGDGDGEFLHTGPPFGTWSPDRFRRLLTTYCTSKNGSERVVSPSTILVTLSDCFSVFGPVS